jgi:hypothetical protein
MKSKTGILTVIAALAIFMASIGIHQPTRADQSSLAPGAVRAAIQPSNETQATATFYAVADATVRSTQPNTNFGGEHYLAVSYYYDEWADEEITLLRFNLDSLPVNAVIDSAVMELYLFYAAGQSPKSLVTYRVTSSWSEYSVTWNTFPSADPTGVVSSVDSVINSYKSWSITGMASYWHSNPANNHGVYIRRLTSETNSFERIFESKDHMEEMPRLVITYHLPTWTFEGRVFEGEVGNESHPLSNVTVSAYGANNPYPDAGVLVASTSTDESGWYELSIPGGYEYYSIRENDPPGYFSVGATSVGGIVRDANWIEYTYPLDGKVLTGNKFWDFNEFGRNRDGVPITSYRLAAQLVEDMRGSEMAPGWGNAVLGDYVQPLFRPDMEEPAYFEFTVMTGAEPSGFIIVSTDAHDFPIPHWNFTGESPTRLLFKEAKDQGQTPARYYKLDTLSYTAENIGSSLIASLGEIPSRIEFLLPEPIPDLAITTTEWMPIGDGDDDANPPIDGELKIDGPDVQAIELIPWESWGDLKAAYAQHYDNYLDQLREDAQKDWDVAAAIHEFGEVLFKGDRVTLAILVPAACAGSGCLGFTIDASGEGVHLIEGEVKERDGLPPVYQFTVMDVSPDMEVPLEISISYTGFPGSILTQFEEVFKFVIGDYPNSIYIPMVSKNYSGLQASEINPAGSIMSSWGPWTFWWVQNKTTDQRNYSQIEANTPPNNTSCKSGCGATAWAMLFGWADYQARAENSWNYWKPRSGIYRENGGYGADAVAPKDMDAGIENISWEIRNHINTLCIFGKAPTVADWMKDASEYLKYRSNTKVGTKYSSWCTPWNDIRYKASMQIYETRTPVVIGTGICSHYPLAYGFAQQSRTVKESFLWWSWTKTEYNHAFWVNQGWGGNGNGWVGMQRSWFAGYITP